MKCETCQAEETVHVQVIDRHFCAACVSKIDARIAEINSKPMKPRYISIILDPGRSWTEYGVVDLLAENLIAKCARCCDADAIAKVMNIRHQEREGEQRCERLIAAASAINS